MSLNEIKEWLIPVGTLIALATGSVSTWLALRDYRLKLASEVRLADASRTESDIKLVTLFTVLMNTAHGRGGELLSEQAVEALLRVALPEKGPMPSPLPPLTQLLAQNAVITLPVGAAAQDSAIAAIGELGIRYPILRPIALQGLTSLMSFKSEAAGPYLERLRAAHASRTSPRVSA